jgi:hypothetical protein
MFKVGDKVVAVETIYGLIKYKEYIVQDVTRVDTVKVYGCAHYFFCSRFKRPEAKTPRVGQAGGLKFDGGKAQWGLLLSGKGMLAGLLGVVKVLMFGAKKYAAHSWREVEDNERRYLDGLFRHYAAIMEHGLQAKDEESGELHIDHLNCNGLFLAEIARATK